MTKLEYHLTPFQSIYTESLRKPREGYAASTRFTLAPFDCPECTYPVYVRRRTTSYAPIGCICPNCGWMATYRQKPALPRAPLQQKLF